MTRRNHASRKFAARIRFTEKQIEFMLRDMLPEVRKDHPESEVLRLGNAQLQMMHQGKPLNMVNQKTMLKIGKKFQAACMDIPA